MESDFTHKQFENLLNDLPKVFREVPAYHNVFGYSLMKIFAYIHSEQAANRMNGVHLSVSYEFKELAKLCMEDLELSHKRIRHIHRILKKFKKADKL